MRHICHSLPFNYTNSETISHKNLTQTSERTYKYDMGSYIMAEAANLRSCISESEIIPEIHRRILVVNQPSILYIRI